MYTDAHVGIYTGVSMLGIRTPKYGIILHPNKALTYLPTLT